MGLLLRHFDCDNILLDILSTPNYGLAIPSPQWLIWETAIAKVVVNNMKENQRICSPTNLQKNVFLMFYIGNIDWLEDTPGGKKYILFTEKHFSKKNT